MDQLDIDQKPDVALPSPPRRPMDDGEVDRTDSLEGQGRHQANNHAEHDQGKESHFESQPMLALSSSSSHASTKEQETISSNGLTPYGTRSRNRAGASRPNYAEDRDPEADHDFPSSQMASSVTNEHHETTRTTSRVQSGASSARRQTTLTEGTDDTQGTSRGPRNAGRQHMTTDLRSSDASNASISAPQPKRRKVAEAEPAQNQQSDAISTHASRGKPSRAGTGLAPGYSNLMSFEKSQGYLRHGKLKADDGTSLALNGALSSVSSFRTISSTAMHAFCEQHSYLRRLILLRCC